MTTVDIDAIRERYQKFEDLGTELSPSNYRIVAIAARSAGDVPVLLAEVDRLVTRLGTVRAHRDELARAHDQAVADLSVLKSTEDAEAVLLRSERNMYAAAIARVVAGLNPDDYTTAAEMFAAVKDALRAPGGQHG